MSITIGAAKAKELLESGMKKAEEMIKDPSWIDDLLLQSEKILKDVPIIGETLSDVPLMISMVKAWATGEYTEVSTRVITIMVSSLIYMVSPVDLMPDSLKRLGSVDDIAVLAEAMRLCRPELDAYAAFRDAAAAKAEEKPEEASEDYSEVIPEE